MRPAWLIVWLKKLGRKDVAMSCDPSTTSILLLDLCNDFLREGGKLWPRAKAVAEPMVLTTDELMA